jgi:hypothetical protein
VEVLRTEKILVDKQKNGFSTVSSAPTPVTGFLNLSSYERKDCKYDFLL